jgi:hypothetical protein
MPISIGPEPRVASGEVLATAKTEISGTEKVRIDLAGNEK